MKYYIIFGQGHHAEVCNKLFDKDCIAEIEAMTKKEAKSKADRAFGRYCYMDTEQPELKYYPRGIIKL